MNIKKTKKILKTVELYFLVVSYAFVGFFIMMTGISLLPKIAEVSRDGSYAPFFYALSIIVGFIYFAYYKTVKLIIKDNSKEGEKNEIKE